MSDQHNPILHGYYAKYYASNNGCLVQTNFGCVLATFKNILPKKEDQYNPICDWASENGPSEHTKFDHIFHICCIITCNVLKLYKCNFYHQLTIS